MNTKVKLTEEQLKAFQAEAGNGSQEVETQWPPSIDWDKTPLVSGVVKELESMTIRGRPTSRATLTTKDGEVSLWHSASLSTLFAKLHVGDRVTLCFAGYEELEDNKRQRLFKVAYTPKR